MTAPADSDITITAVVASYNSAPFINKTLDAVLNQTRAPDAVIVVDDGSSDNTLAVLNAYGDRISVIQIPNGGPEVAKKTGIEAATTSFVSLCDHDDLWLPEHLARLAALMARYPDADFAFSNYEEVGTAAKIADKFAFMGDAYWAGPEVDRDGFQYWGAGTYPKILAANAFFPSAGLFRKSLYEEVGGINECFSFNPAADADMTRRFAIAGNLAVDHKITAQINKHGENYSKAGEAATMGRLTILADNLQEGGLFDPYRDTLSAAYKDAATWSLWTAFYERDAKSFRAAAQHLGFWQRSLALKLRSIYMALPKALRRF